MGKGEMGKVQSVFDQMRSTLPKALSLTCEHLRGAKRAGDLRMVKGGVVRGKTEVRKLVSNTFKMARLQRGWKGAVGMQTGCSNV